MPYSTCIYSPLRSREANVMDLRNPFVPDGTRSVACEGGTSLACRLSQRAVVMSGAKLSDLPIDFARSWTNSLSESHFELVD